MSLNPSKLLLGLLTPFITAGSGLLVAAAGKYGVHLDPSGINALGVAGATMGGAAMVKLIHDVESRTGVVKVAAAVEAADPGAKGLAEDAVAQASKALQEQFNTLVASLPKTPDPTPAPAPAPAPVAPPPPAA